MKRLIRILIFLLEITNEIIFQRIFSSKQQNKCSCSHSRTQCDIIMLSQDVCSVHTKLFLPSSLLMTDLSGSTVAVSDPRPLITNDLDNY